MARRRKGKRGVGHSTSILTTLFAVTPALYLLTNTPTGSTNSPLGGVLVGGGTWQSIYNALWALAQNVVQNWVTVLILVAVMFIAIHVVRKASRGTRISKHLRM